MRLQAPAEQPVIQQTKDTTMKLLLLLYVGSTLKYKNMHMRHSTDFFILLAPSIEH